MIDDEMDLFRKELGDVDPIKAPDRATQKQAREVTPGLLERREAAVTEKQVDPNFLSDEHFPRLDPHEPIGFRRDGMQHGVYRKLRLGRLRNRCAA